jgi:hypothetical protein
MKKFAVVTLTILALLFSFLPMSSAQAKKDPTDVTLKVRNRTGGVVELKLVDQNGDSRWFRYDPGQTNTPLPEGLYTYYASTPCGNQSGIFNVNITKELLFACNRGVEVSLNRRSVGGGGFCYSVVDYDPDEVWGIIGAHCQSDAANVGDWIVFYNPFWDSDFPYYYYNSGKDACDAPEYGSAYYYDDCGGEGPGEGE